MGLVFSNASHVGRGQPARALPYYLRLRKPHVFDLIREHNLFDAVQEQALLLVEFDRERIKEDPSIQVGKHGAAIELLVDHTMAIPVDRVVQQLEAKPQFLYMYLDSLFDKDPQACQQYSDRMVRQRVWCANARWSCTRPTTTHG